MNNTKCVETPPYTLHRCVFKFTIRASKPVSYKHYQSGSAMSEYLIGTAAVVIALFAPIPGLNESALVFMVDALRGFQANTTYIMSLP